ncbi:AAA family ATPase [Trueperella pyogenes]|uniref:AAA family ATPase n=1 Tax=Trueperella pyogenes TaxID=1661 RepID=UPI003132E342
MPRVVDSLVADRLKISVAAVLEGPRACGKTRTGAEQSTSRFYLDSQGIREMILLAPDLAFNAERPVLLDEWQLAPYLWNEVHSVDSDPTPGQFILTGSSVPSDDVTRHTGAGKFLRIRMRTMTWSEKAKQAGEFRLPIWRKRE